MKRFIPYFLFIHMLAMHVAAAVVLPRMQVYPNALRQVPFSHKPTLVRERSCLAALLDASSNPLRSDNLQATAFDPIFSFFVDAPPLGAFTADVFRVQIQRVLSRVQTPPAVMIWFSLLGWYP